MLILPHQEDRVMGIYSLTKNLHYFIGLAALSTFWIAAFTRKGSPLHKLVGKIYLLAMTGIILTAATMTVISTLRDPGPMDAFLGYLLIITATGMWTSWRAIRDKRDFARYTGPVYRVLEVLNPVSALAVLLIGINIHSVLLSGFSAVGFFIGLGMWRLRRNGPPHALWWRNEHFTGMIGNGVATHIAFLSIGLPKVLPMLAGPTLQNLAWFGPLVVATVVGIWLTRKYTPKTKAIGDFVGAASGRE
jgi:uncharacterized membrane protein